MRRPACPLGLRQRGRPVGLFRFSGHDGKRSAKIDVTNRHQNGCILSFDREGLARGYPRAHSVSCQRRLSRDTPRKRVPIMNNTSTVLVTGNTYPVKDSIKALGGRWDAAAKGWRVPADKADSAKALVASGRQPTPRQPLARSYGRPRGRWTGCSCGSIDGQPRKSDCWQCRHDSE